jgi:heptosyltransferase-2
LESMQYKRILIFNVNWLGDVLFSTAAIRNIRRNFPESFIACVIPSRCYHVLKGNPHLDEIIIFDEKDRHKNTLEKLRFISRLRSKKFDVAFLLHRSLTRALICRLAGIPERIGYFTKKRQFLLTKKIAAPDIQSLHRIDYYLNIIEKAGLRCEDRFTEFFFGDEERDFVEVALAKKGIDRVDLLIGINAGGNWNLKRWPLEHWAILADELIKRFKAKVIISGSVSDSVLARQVSQSMKNELIIACGAFNLKQLGALFKRLDFFITADTGPLHIANAVGAKNIVALFGPTSPKITGPYPTNNVIVLAKDVGCAIPCYMAGCKDNRCMKAITPEEVLGHIGALIKDK